MTIDPQNTFDKLGNPIGVFLPIEEWNTLSAELHLDIPKWQKDLIDVRMEEYKSNPGDTLDWDDILKQLDKEHEAV